MIKRSLRKSTENSCDLQRSLLMNDWMHSVRHVFPNRISQVYFPFNYPTLTYNWNRFVGCDMRKTNLHRTTLWTRITQYELCTAVFNTSNDVETECISERSMMYTHQYLNSRMSLFTNLHVWVSFDEWVRLFRAISWGKIEWRFQFCVKIK